MTFEYHHCSQRQSSVALPEFGRSAAMRILFSTVIIFGLVMIGLSMFELRVVGEYRSKVGDVQNWLAAWEKKEQQEAQKMGIAVTGTSSAYMFGRSVDGIDRLERGWLAGAYIGGALFLLGATGFIIARRSGLQKSPTAR